MLPLPPALLPLLPPLLTLLLPALGVPSNTPNAFHAAPLLLPLLTPDTLSLLPGAGRGTWLGGMRCTFRAAVYCATMRCRLRTRRALLGSVCGGTGTGVVHVTPPQQYDLRQQQHKSSVSMTQGLPYQHAMTATHARARS
jgi:hypothetical protein